MSEDPWKGINVPNTANAISARRVNSDIQWGFFWARGLDGQCLFAIQHCAASTPRARFPVLRDIEITDADWVDGNSRVLIFKLIDSSQRDLFRQLCLDIVSCAAGANTEREAVLLAVARTWRWHHLLKGGSDSLLSLEEQKGLIGELLVLERHILQQLPPADAIAAWRGPLGSPKDFEIGRVCIEVKARRGAGTPQVAISSESQLDGSGIEALFLYVVDLDRAPSGTIGRFTLSDLVTRIQNTISGSDEAAREVFEGLVVAAGFRWSDDYSDLGWIEGAHHIYHVRDGCPRITASQIPQGVSEVRYSISLVSCEPYAVDDAKLEAEIRGDADVQ